MFKLVYMYIFGKDLEKLIESYTNLELVRQIGLIWKRKVSDQMKSGMIYKNLWQCNRFWIRPIFTHTTPTEKEKGQQIVTSKFTRAIEPTN